MSGAELYVDYIQGRLYAAVLRKSQMERLYVDAVDRTAIWASLYVGRVAKIERSLNAAIIDLGDGVSGILQAKHALPAPTKEKPQISAMLEPGQIILCQVKSEAKHEAAGERHKLPRLTMKTYLMGQYAIYCPVSAQHIIGVKSDDAVAAEHSRRLPRGKGGWLIQSAAARAEDNDFDHETAAIAAAWQRIEDDLRADPATPRLLRMGPLAYARMFYDYGVDAFDNIYAGNREIFDRIAKWSGYHAPRLADSKRLRLFKPEKPGQTLFDIHDIHMQIEALNDKYVTLPGGGSIIVEETAAMTVIDVNQLACPTRVQANVEAIDEIYRQTQMRSLSGAILIDCIGMPERTDRATVLARAERLFAGDPAGAQVLGYTRLGILEIARKRRSSTLSEELRN